MNEFKLLIFLPSLLVILFLGQIVHSIIWEKMNLKIFCIIIVLQSLLLYGWMNFYGII